MRAFGSNERMKVLRGLGVAAGTILLYLGLPLMGWGLGHLPGFFSSAERTAYSFVVGAFGLAVGYQAIDGPEGVEGGKGREEKLVRRQTVIGGIAVGLLFTCLFLLPYADRRSMLVMAEPRGLRWLGTPLAAFGYLLVYLSGLFLGKQYSAEVTVQEDHQLITNGPYRYIRHPRYLGVALLALGMSLIFRSWIGLGLTPVILALLLLRVRDEEALMQGEFKEQWEAYCRRTKRLLPFLY
jgi:protein-S-isoprenylcysteine O-methyltransferase Ste14